MESTLFGPDASDPPTEAIEEVGDRLQVMARGFVNRWVFLKHQRPAALAELQELLACHSEILSTVAPSIESGTGATVAPSAVSAVGASPTPRGGANGASSHIAPAAK